MNNVFIFWGCGPGLTVCSEMLFTFAHLCWNEAESKACLGYQQLQGISRYMQKKKKKKTRRRMLQNFFIWMFTLEVYDGVCRKAYCPQSKQSKHVGFFFQRSVFIFKIAFYKLCSLSFWWSVLFLQNQRACTLQTFGLSPPGNKILVLDLLTILKLWSIRSLGPCSNKAKNNLIVYFKTVSSPTPLFYATIPFKAGAELKVRGLISRQRNSKLISVF